MGQKESIHGGSKTGRAPSRLPVTGWGTKVMAEPRYVILHGHFYQPPRESPWTGLITREPDAAPFANWNERILSECYTANARAQVIEGSVVHIRNNYEAIDFDLGPTLAAWLERHGKTAYRALRRADEASRVKRGGYGNAIAQAYNHSILPLLAPRDRQLQVAWGIEDFVYRMGRRPDGMWLPECAADDETFEVLAAAGIKFTIVGADQGRFTGPGGHSRAAGPFVWRGGERTLAVFRSDGPLAREISFGDGLRDGVRLAEQIAQAALELEAGSALLIAADGEIFGHHKRAGAAELARAIMCLERRDDVQMTNCAAYLAAHPASGAFEMTGPSSWSCLHGIERWRSECGCRIDSNTNQRWRAPLFEAMQFVRNHAEAVYDRFATGLVENPSLALAESVRLFIDQRPAPREDFFARHKVADETGRERLLRLCEMVRAGQAALTSCSWFFDDFGGLEGRIALRWAARAVELAAEFMPGIEGELVARLRGIHSNRRDIGDGATLYLSLKAREARGRV
jgi:Domain of unknown function (DUF3536)/Glycosyl hydrolase family 57